jgi:hypothetical protein
MSHYTTDLPTGRVREPRPPPPSIPAARRAEQRKASEKKQSDLNSRIEAWLEYSENTAANIASDFGYTIQHVRTLLHNSGVRLLHARPAGNTYNAFMSHMARQSKLILCVMCSILIFPSICSLRREGLVARNSRGLPR